MAIKKITDNVFQINHDSNIYYIKDLNIIIDCGNRLYLKEFESDLKQICKIEKIKAVILTHLHYDHIGCFDLFENAIFYASDLVLENQKEFENNKDIHILNKEISEIFNIKLKPISKLKLSNNYEIIFTPGHSKSSISIYDNKEKILFSGDTLFYNDAYGRYDLPTSDYEELKNSLKKLKKLDYKILCPGHNY